MDDAIKQGAIVLTPEKKMKREGSGEHQGSGVIDGGIIPGPNDTENSEVIKEPMMNVAQSPSSSNAAASAKSQAGPLLIPGYFST